MEKYHKAICFFAAFIACLCCLALFFTFSIHKRSEYSAERNVIVDNVTDNGIADLLVKEKLSRNFFMAKIIVKVLKLAGHTSKFGEYELPIFVSPADAIKIFASGKAIIHKITIPEGFSVPQVIRRIEKNESLLGEIEKIPEEGSLMPDTYCFKYPTTKQKIISMAQKAMQEFLKQEWKNRSTKCLLKTPREALILASIVEKETNLEKEMIAGIYFHRLKKGMRLESCPTVIYALKRGDVLDHQLKYSDLRIKDPYNTYLNKGLPPSPISNPGKLSIIAVLHPYETENLFFVAEGTTGKHIFSKTYKEHKRNIANVKKTYISKVK
jgi:UPF0755 protein